MRRKHRKVHRIMWLILGPLAILGLVVGVMNRAPIPPQDSPLNVRLPDAAPPSREVEDR